ncbi:hypothetical protein BLD48_05700 [Exiguobacterium sp. KRL4]|uniref:pyocin knob domain-containing protein n=1 Tax=Exiguobacterium sp. KRL4 TaxID=1914536 RepID=UPI0008F865E8|nr:pyocin knob domain-containing protein [Exiguobacterium sp. KRL4]OIN67384.1 hypothetical protein BLD48_05700 [Exiguobacterium sp. KRL4]
MATNTPNFLLPKPDANDNFNRIAYNALIDAIDSKVGAKTNAADTHMADLIKHITSLERDKWNAAQLFALTSSVGSGKTPTSNDLNATITAGFYNVQASNLNSNSSSGTMFVSTRGSSGISQILHTTANKLFTRFSGDGGTTWSTWLEQESATGAQAKVDAHAADAVKHITTPERDKWNAGQLWKLTESTGFSKYNASQDDADVLLNSGNYACYSSTKNVPESGGHLYVIQRDGSQVAQTFIGITSNIYIRTYSATWKQWRKLTDNNTLGNVLFGNKLVDQSNANFVGKVAGSSTENPHRSSAVYGSTSLATPSAADTVQAVYDALKSIDLSRVVVSNTGSGHVSQQLFSFNIVEHIQRTYGNIPGVTTAEKVTWLRNNLSKLTFNWWGFGSSVGGNKANISFWNGSSWTYWTSNSANTPSKSSIISTGIASLVQTDGFAYFVAYADASDGTTASVINTDYAELVVELSTDIKSGLANATTSTAGLQSGADKAKLDGISTGANKTTSSGTNGNVLVDNAQVQVYAHPTGDGNSHVPATGTTNGGKVLKAGGTANALSWAFVDWSEILNKPSTFLPSAHTHAIADVTGLSAALSGKLDTSQRGAVNGVASLGSDGKVPTSQLPTIANAAADITIADAGNYFDGANVETGMQEIGRVLAGARTSLVTSAQQLGVI